MAVAATRVGRRRVPNVIMMWSSDESEMTLLERLQLAAGLDAHVALEGPHVYTGASRTSREGHFLSTSFATRYRCLLGQAVFDSSGNGCDVEVPDELRREAQAD